MLRPHRVPENCAFTTQHDAPDKAQVEGAPTSAGRQMINGGLQVVNPSAAIYQQISDRLTDPAFSDEYDFADQSLLSDLFKDRWVPLPYIYNALKTLRWKNVHAPIWRDDQVKNIHYILSPKPWDDDPQNLQDETHAWWLRATEDRRTEEKTKGIDDGF